ncbi:MAG: rhodanese-like domain-containing protein [Planctomycetota bacterium]|jgi:rhodanese-related sulfurtransferase
MLEISVEEVHRRVEAGEPLHLLDVRELDEVSICGLPGAEHISMLELFGGLRQTSAPKEAEIVIFCHTGQRSYEAARYLRLQGYPNAFSMAGGIDAWSVRIDPGVVRY